MAKYYSIQHSGLEVIQKRYSSSVGSNPSSAEAVILMAGMRQDFVERHGLGSIRNYGGVTDDMFLLALQYSGQQSALLFFTEPQGKSLIRSMKAANAQGLEGRAIKALLEHEIAVGVKTGK